MNTIPLSCISMINQECRIRPQIVNINSEESFFLLALKQLNAVVVATISIIHMQNCVPHVVKNLNVRAFNLMSRTNETTRHIEWHETCKCKCRLDASVCNSKQRWNDDKCRCQSKELIDKGVWDKGFIWNPSNCECECDKSCDFSEYLEIEIVIVERNLLIN